MLNNNKCVLVYGINEEEVSELSKAGFKLKIITKDMINMKIKDIISGFKIETVNENYPSEKVFLFNNYEDKVLQTSVKLLRSIVKGGILAAVTPTSNEWTFEYLSTHLIEERDYIKRQQKER